MIIKHFVFKKFAPALLSIVCILFSFNGFAQEIGVYDYYNNDNAVLDLSTNSPNTNNSTDFGTASSITFLIINSRASAGSIPDLTVNSIILSNNTDFEISTAPYTLPYSIRKGNSQWAYFLPLKISLKGTSCGTFTSTVTISSNATNDGSDNLWTFTINAVRSPEINVLGSGISIVDGDTTPINTDNTDFGSTYVGTPIIKTYTIQNTGNCTLTVGAFTFSGTNASEFTIETAPAAILASGASTTFQVKFTPTTAGIRTAAISFVNNDANENPYNFSIQGTGVAAITVGPGGVTADLKLWLRADLLDNTTSVADNTNVAIWKTQSGAVNATALAGKEPVFKNNSSDNINFNAVVNFNNVSTQQYMQGTSGFYSNEMFVVVIPNVTINASTTRNSIFSGKAPSSSSTSDITGVAYGNHTARFTNEVLSYTQNGADSYGLADITANYDYDNVGIINARQNTNSPATGMQLLYNAKNVGNSVAYSTTFENVSNSEYLIGTNKGTNITPNLNGRIAEIITYSSRKDDVTARPKIETYLAIKYGITLGVNGTSQNYVNSNNDPIWSVTTNSGYNYDIAGIGRDDASKLNQKQSKSVNTSSTVTIGLGTIAATNTANTNTFITDKSYLVWGHNNLSLADAGSNFGKTIGTAVQTNSRILNRKWKIVETTPDVSEVIISIPTASLSLLSKTLNDEYVLIVSSMATFANGDIVDIIPLKTVGSNLQTWYDFDGTKYFTFGIAAKIDAKYQSNIAAGDYFVGENNINLNSTFTISSWIKNSNTGSLRTFIAKGMDYELKINMANLVEVSWNGITRITSKTSIGDGKWHHMAITYSGGSASLYMDGILDKIESSLPIPIFSTEKFSIGAAYISKTISNPFLGDIDEVIIWDSALTEVQLHYLMNQEMEKFSDNNVSGKVIPQIISRNDVKTIPWTNVKAYYDLNTYYGTTSDDKSNNRNFLRVKYLNATKSIVNTQMAPLPYKSVLDGTWDTNTTWSSNSTQYLPNTIITRNGIPNEITWNIVQTAHNIASGARDINVLGLISTAGKLTIDGNNALGTGQSLRVTHYLELDGRIDLEGESQLVQDEGSILDADSGGDLERDQQGTANSFNYNYWSSSVGPVLVDTNTKNTRGTGIASVNAPFTIDGVIKDGRNSSPAAITYDSSPFSADAGSLGALTISSYWLYQFYGKNDDYNSWFPRINENSVLAPGVGYTMKGSSGKVPITNQQNYVFRGKPYNGYFTLPLVKGTGYVPANTTGNVDRLIGNPYPSAMDSKLFILDNLSTANGGTNTNGNIFNGALYFWDHFGQRDTHILREYVGGYATRNLTTGVKAQSTDARINNDNSWGDKTPGQYIPVNQAFFVNTTLDGFKDINNIVIPSVSGGAIVFKNSQRAFQKESLLIGNSVFMKTEKAKDATIQNKEVSNEETKPIIKLMFDSPTGYHRQIALGAVENTSNNFDLGYDAFLVDIGLEDMYWTIQGAKFVIQGVPNFDENQEFPLAVKIAKTGLARIKIDELENMDENLSLHIKDKLTGKTHNISQKSFEINLEAGTYIDRFALIFKRQKLVAEDLVTEVLIPVEVQPINEGIHVFMNNATGELQIKNNSDEEILSIELYNYLGQTVKTWNSNFKIRTISLPVNIVTGIYIVQINTKTGKTIKKISVE